MKELQTGNSTKLEIIHLLLELTHGQSSNTLTAQTNQIEYVPLVTPEILDHDHGQRVTEIKFFLENKELMIALFTEPPAFWSTEYWLKNVRAKDYGITQLPTGFQLEKKYNSSSINLDNMRIQNDSYEIQKVGNGIASTAIKALFGLFF